ncbi:MAG: 50S ribosomal protein L11 methyltransferase [Bacteroidetes bacterium]|nr:50S ribosomal protein L11 methyltransferase [Bacteroidota bacterium]MCH8523266.1 50S ribosomal protein L11 methyltransferase [Balneolales bacterium]
MQTDQNYLEIEIEIPADYHEILISELMELDFDGFEQHDDYLLAYIPQSRYNDVSREHIETWVSAQNVPCFIRGERIYEPKNWNEEWEKTIQPMLVGSFFVRPTWTPVETPQGAHLLEIDPKMAFGTGYHETTRCMLRMMPETIKGGEHVLDIGTGTGILAIAALKLNASTAFGFDIDEWSSVNATENALINAVSKQFTVKEGSFETIPPGTQYDVVLANVNRNMLLETTSQIVSLVRDGGRLLLSGLLETDEHVILSSPEYASLKLQNRLQENEWICLRFDKR